MRQIAMQNLGGDLLSLSPLRYAGSISARILLIDGQDDRLVPIEQGVRMAAALRGRGRLIAVPAGTTTWMHGTGTAKAIRQANRAADALLEDSGSRAPGSF